MHKIKALKLFKDSRFPDNFINDSGEEVVIDFMNIDYIELKDIKTLLDLQKIALLNNKKFRIENAKPEILQMLEVTGLYKTFSNLMTNPIFISKRLKLN